MAEEDFYVASLKRQRTHLKDDDADPGKLAENAEFLRLAGVDVDKLDEPEKEEKPAKTERAKTATPKGRSAPPKSKTAEKADEDSPGVTSDFLSGKPREKT